MFSWDEETYGSFKDLKVNPKNKNKNIGPATGSHTRQNLAQVVKRAPNQAEY